MAEHPDIVILGGGVIGLTTAYYLARDGARVAVADKGEFGQEASWAGAGILTGGNPRRAHSPMGRLRALSAAAFPDLSADLRARTGIDNGYLRCGALELRRSEDALEKQRLENLLKEERGEGLHCEVLDARQLRELEPALAPALPGAILYPDAGQVRNPRHLKALLAACGQLGVTLKPGWPIFALERAGDRVTTAVGPDGRLAGGRFLIAAGAWSDMLAGLVGWTAHVRPVRGQIALLALPAPPVRRVLLAGSEYLVPRPDGRTLVGSTEEDVGFDKRTTAAGVEGLLALARHLVPALAAAQVERCWAGLRPGSPDGRPFLGAVPGWANLYLAAGHFRSGLQTSPATGLVMKELLLGQALSLPLEPFRPDRPLPPASRGLTSPEVTPAPGRTSGD